MVIISVECKYYKVVSGFPRGNLYLKIYVDFHVVIVCVGINNIQLSFSTWSPTWEFLHGNILQSKVDFPKWTFILGCLRAFLHGYNFSWMQILQIELCFSTRKSTWKFTFGNLCGFSRGYSFCWVKMLQSELGFFTWIFILRNLCGFPRAHSLCW